MQAFIWRFPCTFSLGPSKHVGNPCLFTCILIQFGVFRFLKKDFVLGGIYIWSLISSTIGFANSTHDVNRYMVGNIVVM
jgi:hypothetical protein